MALPILHRSKPLKSGATIGVIATGSPLSPERFQLGVSEIESRGFKVRTVFDPTKYYGKSDHGFSAESVAARVDGVHKLLDDPEVQAIIAVRGAYGTLDLLPLIDFKRFSAAKKLLVGCSDVTALLAQISARAQMPAIHGPTLGSSFADAKTDVASRESVDATWALLTDPSYRYKQEVQVLRDGSGEGQLVVGNLTMFLSLLGTPWDFDYSGAVLVVEDVGEAPYRIHRAFTQLKYAGKLDRLSGLVFGRFSRCQAEYGPSVNEVITMVVEELLKGKNYPVISGLEIGHWGKNIPLAWGCRAAIQGNVFATLETPLIGK